MEDVGFPPLAVLSPRNVFVFEGLFFRGVRCGDTLLKLLLGEMTGPNPTTQSRCFGPEIIRRRADSVA